MYPSLPLQQSRISSLCSALQIQVYQAQELHTFIGDNSDSAQCTPATPRGCSVINP